MTTGAKEVYNPYVTLNRPSKPPALITPIMRSQNMVQSNRDRWFIDGDVSFTLSLINLKRKWMQPGANLPSALSLNNIPPRTLRKAEAVKAVSWMAFQLVLNHWVCFHLMGVWLSKEKLTQEGQIKGMVKQNLLVLLLLAFFFFFPKGCYSLWAFVFALK